MAISSCAYERHSTSPIPAESLLTIQAAAAQLGVHAWALRRAVKRGDVASYKGFNSRRLVRLSEVLVVIEASRMGGA